LLLVVCDRPSRACWWDGTRYASLCEKFVKLFILKNAAKSKLVMARHPITAMATKLFCPVADLDISEGS
jgi:hypothetical protein